MTQNQNPDQPFPQNRFVNKVYGFFKFFEGHSQPVFNKLGKYPGIRKLGNIKQKEVLGGSTGTQITSCRC